MAKYKLIGVSSARIVEWTVERAPSEGAMCRWAETRSASFVIRYFPSRKAWRWLDVRQAKAFPIPGRTCKAWRGQKRGARWFPNEDAAVMHCMALLGVTPDT